MSYKVPVDALLADQLPVGTPLDDAALIQHQDLVGAAEMCIRDRASTMLDNGTERSYIDTMSASAPSWLLAVIVVGTLVIAAFSGWIGGKMLKKQFEKAGITA